MTIERRPLTARGVVASTLLGTKPPMLSARRLVRVGELFAMSGGSIRVALSRMTAGGELVKDNRGYRLAGDLLARQAHQDSSRHRRLLDWDNQWEIVTITATGRSAAERSMLRSALATRRLAELREGTWVRPANLDADRNQGAMATMKSSCTSFSGSFEGDDRALCATLWDLEGWRADACELHRSISRLSAQLHGGDKALLGPGFIESAAVLRLLTLDPMLPEQLEPSDWPSASLRETYEAFDLQYRLLLREWLDAS